jgi:hypothetical protein
MGCRVLGHAEYAIDDAVLAAMTAGGAPAAAVAELGLARGARFPTEDALHDYVVALVNAAALTAPGNYDRLRAAALVDDCGKRALWPDAVLVTPVAGAPVRRERMSAASLASFTATAPDVDLLVDPVRGRFKLAAAPAVPAGVRVDHAYGFGGPIGAGGHDRRATVADVPDIVVPAAPPAGGAITAAHYPVVLGRISGITEVPDSATYAVQAGPSDVARLTVQAANLARPYLRLAGDWIFTAAAGLEAELALDGLWIGARAPAAIVLRGAWSRVAVRGCTLDPGGVDVDGAVLAPVPIFVEGQVDELAIDHSIAARIATRAGGVIDAISVADSILDAGAPPGGAAIALTPGTATLRRATILGAVDVERLDASCALITGAVDVTDTQAGCFRFSSAPAGSRLPRPYRWVPWSGGPVFASTRFGDPGYAWLAESAPEALRRGGEEGGEIGAWNAALLPIKEDSLLRKVEEYLPFGLIPLFIRET